MSTALPRIPFNGQATGFYQVDGPRSPSPPASTYFPSVSLDLDREPQPTPDADQHFAYSTTLRRHQREGSLALLQDPTMARFQDMANTLRGEGIARVWQRVVSTVTGQPADQADSLENGYARLVMEPEVAQMETPSARFAHCTAEETLGEFQTSPDRGLSSSRIPDLQATHGYNEFSVSTPESMVLKFAKTIYESPLILLLCASAVISAIMGNVDDAVSITVAVLIVLTVGFVQEQRSEKSLEALNKLVPHHCHVLRDGQSVHILANELVPGDIITLSTGDRVPADVRLVAAVDLEVDESSLTGETVARKKSTEACAFDIGGAGEQEPVSLADRTCIGYMGTLVRNGMYSCLMWTRLLTGLYRPWNWDCNCNRNTDGIWCYFFYDARRTLTVPLI
jgi:Ca2+-transporting ATPase